VFGSDQQQMMDQHADSMAGSTVTRGSSRVPEQTSVTSNGAPVFASPALRAPVVANPACHGQPDSSYPILTRTCIR
jgi:hypothetical protein